MIRSARCALRAALPVFALLVCGFFSPAAAQSSSASDNPPAASSPAAKDASGQEKSVGADSAAQKPPKARKVITNDDIDVEHARARAAQRLAEGANSGDLIPQGGLCDDACAHDARRQLDYGVDREGEWQFQLATARRNLALDTRWRNINFELTQAVQLYCSFVNQQQKAAVPTGNDYQSRVERARRQQYVESMGRTLSQKVDNATSNLNRYIAEKQQGDPVLAAIMYVLEWRVLNSCPYTYDP